MRSGFLSERRKFASIFGSPARASLAVRTMVFQGLPSISVTGQGDARLALHLVAEPRPLRDRDDAPLSVARHNAGTFLEAVSDAFSEPLYIAWSGSPICDGPELCARSPPRPSLDLAKYARVSNSV